MKIKKKRILISIEISVDRKLFLMFLFEIDPQTTTTTTTFKKNDAEETVVAGTARYKHKSSPDSSILHARLMNRQREKEKKKLLFDKSFGNEKYIIT